MAFERPADRAMGLLRSVLSPEQRKDLVADGGFAERTATHLYWIPLHGRPARARLDGGSIERLCVSPDRVGGMPSADVALTFLLWIRGDHSTFLDRANVVERRAFRWHDERSFRDAVLGRRRGLDRTPQPRPAPVPRPIAPPRRTRPAVVELPLLPAPFQAAPAAHRRQPQPRPTIDRETVAAIVARMRELRVRLTTARLTERMGATTPPATIEGIARRLVLASSPVGMAGGGVTAGHGA